MSLRSKRRQSEEVDEDLQPPASYRRRSSQSQDVDHDDEEEVEVVDEGAFCFSSQAPEASQSVQAEKVNERSMYSRTNFF